MTARQKTWGLAASSSHTSSIQEATSRLIPGLSSVWRPEYEVLEVDEVRLCRISLLSSILNTRSLRKMLGSLQPRSEVRPAVRPPVSTATMSGPSMMMMMMKCSLESRHDGRDVSSTKVSTQLRGSCRGCCCPGTDSGRRRYKLSVLLKLSSSSEIIEFMARFNARNINENMILLSNLRSANINWKVRVIKYILSPGSHWAEIPDEPPSNFVPLV